MKPLDTYTGYYLRSTTAAIHTDNSDTGFLAPIVEWHRGPSHGRNFWRDRQFPQNLGVFFVGDQIGLYFNHTSTFLAKRLPRGAHVTVVVRFTSTKVEVNYDLNGVRSSESKELQAAVQRETASNSAWDTTQATAQTSMASCRR